MSTAPVLRAAGWDDLIAALAQPPDAALPPALAGPLARAVLAAPAALAYWIAQREPQLVARERLRLLVIGAETVDAADQGRWYALLPRLLGTAAQVETTLVGESLDLAFASAAAARAPARPAVLARAELAAFLQRQPPEAFDIAAVFHPGLQKNRGWLASAGFARILASGVPLVASSYEQEEAQVDAWVLEAHGYATAGEPLANPFSLDLSHDRTRVEWGRALWKFAPRAPAPGAVPLAERLAALDLLSRMVMHSMLEGGGAPFAPGAPLELASSAGTRLELIHVFDRCCVDPAGGALLRLTERGALEPLGTLRDADLAAWPEGGSELERALWAGGVKARYLLAPGAAALGTTYGTERAAAMLSTLRERARELFRGGY